MEENHPRPLERTFNSTSARVLDFLILNQQFDYSQSDISRLARVPPRSLQRILPTLVSEKLVSRSRKSGKSFMYLFNSKTERGQALLRYFRRTMKEDIEYLKNPNEQKIDNIVNRRLTAQLR